MTKFEQIGRNFQLAATDKAEANRSFRYSCDCCCNKGIRIDCDRCAIAQTHSLVTAYFEEGK